MFNHGIFADKIKKLLKLIRVQHCPSGTRAISTSPPRETSSHQSRPRWRAKGTDMKVRQAHRLAVKAIKIRSLQNRIPMTA